MPTIHLALPLPLPLPLPRQSPLPLPLSSLLLPLALGRPPQQRALLPDELQHGAQTPIVRNAQTLGLLGAFDGADGDDGVDTGALEGVR
jgi:hypothetical protein